MNYDEYAALPGVRATHIKILDKKTPKHLRYAMDHPDDGDTSSRRFLRAVHCAVLEPDVFPTQYSVYSGTRRGKAYDAHRDSHPGTEVLNPAEMARVEAIQKAVHADPFAGPLLTGVDGVSEHTITWTDPDTGLACKARLDRWVSEGLGVVADLKTVGDIEHDALVKMAYRLGWDLQAAHYLDGIEHADGDRFATFMFATFMLVCVEDKAPHDVAVFVMEPGNPMLTAARARRKKLLTLLEECSAADAWRGRYGDLVTLEPFDWMLPQIGDGEDETYNMDDEEIPA